MTAPITFHLVALFLVFLIRVAPVLLELVRWQPLFSACVFVALLESERLLALLCFAGFHFLSMFFRLFVNPCHFFYLV